MTKSRYYPIFINGGGGGKDPELTDITVTPTKEEQTFPTPEGFDGIANVTVEGYTPKTEPIEIVPRRWEIVIPVDTDLVDGWGTITVDAYTPVTETVTIKPQRQAARYLPSPDVDGYREVTVEGVTSDIDQNIKPENIKKDVEILGVTGTLESGVDTFSLYLTGNLENINYPTIQPNSDILAYLFYTKPIKNVTLNTIYSDTKISYNFTSMFEGCAQLQTVSPISVERINGTSNLTCNFKRMFYGCSSLSVTPDIQIKNTESKELSLSYMFYNCNSIESVPQFMFHEFTPASDMDYMFYGCASLKNVSLHTHWFNSYTQKCMFKNCTSLVDISDIVLESKTANQYESMFEGCTSLQTTFSDMPHISYYNQCKKMFYGCSSLKTTPNIPYIEPVYNSSPKCESMFENCTSLEKTGVIGASGNLSQQCTYMFRGCMALREMTWTATTPPTINSNMWTNCPSDMIIYVPDESVDAYKAASVWSSRAAYIKPMSEKPTE